MNQLEIFAYVVCFSLVFKGGVTAEWKTQIRTLWDLVLFTWSLGFINLVYLGGALNYFGVRPGTNVGLFGIVLGVFLHGSWQHLIHNTLPFIILGWLVMLQETHNFYTVTGVIALTDGIGIWLFGRPHTNHIGASGVIFGYLGFLLLHGYFDSNLLSITLSIIVGWLYGWSLRDLFPRQEGVSWEGHLFGFLGGVIAARFL